jgi:hypothetical protein
VQFDNGFAIISIVNPDPHSPTTNADHVERLRTCEVVLEWLMHPDAAPVNAWRVEYRDLTGGWFHGPIVRMSERTGDPSVVASREFRSRSAGIEGRARWVAIIGYLASGRIFCFADFCVGLWRWDLAAKTPWRQGNHETAKAFHWVSFWRLGVQSDANEPRRKDAELLL